MSTHAPAGKIPAVRAAHVSRKVLLRQIAITNYVNPF